MADLNSNEPESKAQPENETVTTRVNVAFPFSQIRVQEPSEDLVALAVLVRELADVVADTVPSPNAQDLRKRARALADRVS